jgi:hypothetical protein
MIDDFVAWLKNPFKDLDDGPTALNYFIFIGLTLVMITLWHFIFRHIREAV